MLRLSQIDLPDVWLCHQRLGVSGRHNTPAFKHIGALSNGKGSGCVLLNQQDRNAVAVNAGNSFKDLFYN
jgi:hypothetical protein